MTIAPLNGHDGFPRRRPGCRAPPLALPMARLPSCPLQSVPVSMRQPRRAQHCRHAAHSVGHPPTASGPRHSTAASQARCRRTLRCDAARSHMAETVSEIHDRFPRFSHEMNDARAYAPGLSSTSAGPPILYRRFRPLSGELAAALTALLMTFSRAPVTLGACWPYTNIRAMKCKVAAIPYQ